MVHEIKVIGNISEFPNLESIQDHFRTKRDQRQDLELIGIEFREKSGGGGYYGVGLTADSDLFNQSWRGESHGWGEGDICPACSNNQNLLFAASGTYMAVCPTCGAILQRGDSYTIEQAKHRAASMYWHYVTYMQRRQKSGSLSQRGILTLEKHSLLFGEHNYFVV